MTAWIAGWLSPMLAFWLYFVPLVFCHVFYFIRTARNWHTDRLTREAARVWKTWNDAHPNTWPTDKTAPECVHYTPTDTVGTIIGRVIVSWLPVANMWAALFDLGPQVFGKFFTWIERVFDQPLVPKG